MNRAYNFARGDGSGCGSPRPEGESTATLRRRDEALVKKPLVPRFFVGLFFLILEIWPNIPVFKNSSASALKQVRAFAEASIYD